MFFSVRHRASRGSAQRRILATTVATLTGLATLSISAAAFADSGSLDVQVVDSSHSKTDFTSDGAQVSYIGDNDANLGSSGTGVFVPFVRLQGSPTEQGYNTDGATEFDTKVGTWTHSVKVSDIPVVVDPTTGKRYWELWNDINETNGTSHIDLTDLEIYFASNPSITGYPFNTDPTNAATNVYDFSGDIKINDVNSGSGRGDLKYLVPLSNISIPANCSYKNPACTTQFVLYSKWGNADAANTFAADGGFEEWKVKTYPSLTVTKTANTSYTRTYHWGITKTASPTSLDMNDGQSGQTTWTVAVTKDQGSDSNWDVNGTITVTNSGSVSAVVNSVTDTLSTDGSVTPVCDGVTFPTTLAAGAHFTCTYDQALSGANNQTNTASATLDSGVTFDGTAPVTFGAPTTLVNDSIDVTDSDTTHGPWSFSDSGSTQYDQQFTCGQDAGHHVNTATITGTATQPSLSASASVDVTCHSPLAPPTGTKSADPTHTHTVKWTITKKVEQNGGAQTHDLNLGTVAGAQTVNYHVVASKTVSNETFGLTGTIEVSNTNAVPVDVRVDDTGLSPAVIGSTCTVTAPNTGTVPAATNSGPGTADFDYSCAFPGDAPVVGTTYQNGATITYSDPRFTTSPVGVTSADIVFPAASLQPGSDAETVTVGDPKAPASAGFPKTISDSTTFPAFSMTYADHGSVAESNTASFTSGATGSDTATVEYTVPAPIPFVAPAVNCSTSATNLSLPVGSNGVPGVKTLQDSVQISGLPTGGTMVVTAVLYGPSATAGVRGNTVVSTQTLTAGNGTTLTSPVSISKPGYYTWEITTSQGQRPCGTTLGHRADYAIAHVPTGFSGPVDDDTARMAPSRLVIPSLRVRATIATAVLHGGALKIPSPKQVGWVNRSAAATDLIGTTIIAGHVSDQHDRPGALYNLHKVRRGQIIEITGPAGVQKYKITSISTFNRNKTLPKSLFSTTGAHRLALVTCTNKVIHGGFFHYTKNLVVIAEPID